MKQDGYPKRLKRSESFFGVHFDFHAEGTDIGIGAETTPEMIGEFLDAVRPDYVQCDCKGHPGWSSYPTKVGNAAPGIVKDALPVWRSATAERGVSLYLHYSGVLDARALSLHPSWACVGPDRKRSGTVISTFGPYEEKLLIPQLKELCAVYGADGVWVDGDCWATLPDYGRKAMLLFEKSTGVSDIPRKPGDPHWEEYLEFCREAFRRYVRRAAAELHRFDPQFEYASNWSFTSYMPEPVSADVDFISGDYRPNGSVDSARFEARCMMGQGKPWDLMAWSFSSDRKVGLSITKTVPQLEQEAAVVLSLGGGFQAYFTQKRNGSIRLWQTKLMAETAKFCRARQQICHHAKPVHQVALLYSGTDYYHRSNRLFTKEESLQEPMMGTLHALLENQYSVEIAMEHQIADSMRNFPLIVNPEWLSFRPGFREKLLGFVKKGGSLLLLGAKATQGFENELGVSAEGPAGETENLWLEHGGWFAGMHTSVRRVHPENGVETFGRLFRSNDPDGPSDTAATIAAYGKGKIAGVYFDFGVPYLYSSTPAARDFLGSLVHRLFPQPAVQVTGSRSVDVCVAEKDGMLIVNLVNTSGPISDPAKPVFDEIPPAGPLEIAVRFPHRPESVRLLPEDLALPFSYDGGVIRLRLDRLEIHSAIAVK